MCLRVSIRHKTYVSPQSILQCWRVHWPQDICDWTQLERKWVYTQDRETSQVLTIHCIRYVTRPSGSWVEGKTSSCGSEMWNGTRLQWLKVWIAIKTTTVVQSFSVQQRIPQNYRPGKWGRHLLRRRKSAYDLQTAVAQENINTLMDTQI